VLLPEQVDQGAPQRMLYPKLNLPLRSNAFELDYSRFFEVVE
jgi:hypothetical protein